MDIAAISTALSNVKTANDVGTAVLAKVINTNEEMGEQVANMLDSAAMERSVNPSVGANIDQYI